MRGVEGGWRRRGCMYNYGWFLYGRNQYSVVKKRYFPVLQFWRLLKEKDPLSFTLFIFYIVLHSINFRASTYWIVSLNMHAFSHSFFHYLPPSFSHSAFIASKVQGWLLNWVSRDRKATGLPTHLLRISVFKSMVQIIFALKSMVRWPHLAQQSIRSKLLLLSQICITPNDASSLFLSLL